MLHGAPCNYMYAQVHTFTRIQMQHRVSLLNRCCERTNCYHANWSNSTRKFHLSTTGLSRFTAAI
jgi:hypothetical protein